MSRWGIIWAWAGKASPTMLNVTRAAQALTGLPTAEEIKLVRVISPILAKPIQVARGITLMLPQFLGDASQTKGRARQLRCADRRDRGPHAASGRRPLTRMAESP